MIIKKEVIDDEGAEEENTTAEVNIEVPEMDVLPQNAAEPDGDGERHVDEPECTSPRPLPSLTETSHINSEVPADKISPVPLKKDTRVSLFECQYCETFYPSADAFRQHSALHSTRNLETIYNCKHCFRGFCTKEQQIVHERNHTGLKPFKCDVCGDQFSFQRSLEYHIQIHGGVRIYKCQICDRTYLQLQQLNLHLKHHTTGNLSPLQPLPGSSLSMTNGTLSPCIKRIDCQIDPNDLLKPIQTLTTEERIQQDEVNDLIEIQDDTIQDFNDENNSQDNINDLLHLSYGKGHHEEEQEEKCTCNRCGMSFKSVTMLQIHMKHRKLVSCPECSERFCSTKVLDEHLTIHEMERNQLYRDRVEAQSSCQPNSFTCFVCSINIKSPRQENIVEFQGSIYYKCDECINANLLSPYVKQEPIENPMENYDDRDIENEMDDNMSQDDDAKSNTSNGDYQCDHCKTQFSGNFALNTHMRMTIRRSCRKCSKPFCNVKLLRRHMREHERHEVVEREVKQESSHQSYYQTSYDHLMPNEVETKRSHEESLACTKCDKVCLGKGALAAHMAHTHTEKTTICKYCGKAFAYYTILKMHLAYRRRDTLKFPCSFCPHRYRNQQELEIHEEYHRSGGRDAKNSQSTSRQPSGRTFANPMAFQQKPHTTTHEIAKSDGNIMVIRRKMRGMEKPDALSLQDDSIFKSLYTERDGVFHCNQCPNSYRGRAGLKAHIYHSHNDKPFICKFCGMPFPFEKMLEFHLRRRKDLKCEVCEDRFCSYGKLDEHMKIHNDPNMGDNYEHMSSASYASEDIIKRVMQNSEIEIALVSDERKVSVKDEFAKSRALSMDHPKAFMQQRFNVERDKQSPIGEKRKMSLEQPQKSGAEQKPVVEQKCPLCPKVMGKRDILNDHIATHLKRYGEYFRCKDCDQKYLYPIFLVRHYKTRTVSQCELCHKNFCTETARANHKCYAATSTSSQQLKRTRTESVSSEEEILPKRSSRMNGTDTRTTSTDYGSNAIHDWEAMINEGKACKCNICGRTYGKPAGLAQHLTWMHGIDTFPCSLCQTMFSSFNHLMRHKNTSCQSSNQEGNQNDGQSKGSNNDGDTEARALAPPSQPDKPVKCPLCEEKFEMRCGLSMHLRFKHKGVQIYECEECGERFSYEKTLEIHHRRVHTQPVKRRRRRRGRKNNLQDADVTGNNEDLDDVDLSGMVVAQLGESLDEDDIEDESGEIDVTEPMDMEIDVELTPSAVDTSDQNVDTSEKVEKNKINEENVENSVEEKDPEKVQEESEKPEDKDITPQI